LYLSDEDTQVIPVEAIPLAEAPRSHRLFEFIGVHLRYSLHKRGCRGVWVPTDQIVTVLDFDSTGDVLIQLRDGSAIYAAGSDGDLVQDWCRSRTATWQASKS
jgi:hypothetical protein